MSDDEQRERPPRPRKGFSRLQFLKGAGVTVAGVGIVGLAGCNNETGTASQPVYELAQDNEMAEKYPDVQAPPTTIPTDFSTLHVLSPEEATTLDALASRIIPGDASDPGAHEAGVVHFIDSMLAYHNGVVQPTYAKGPFAKIYTGAKPSGDTVNGYKVVWVQKSELSRYGHQGKLTPAESYRIGLKALDSYAKDRFGAPFAQLSGTQQDTIVSHLADDKASGFTEPTAQDFFVMVRADTLYGMFSDPLYGGNRNMVGWKMIDYPGAHRAYTPTNILDGSYHTAPQSLAAMMPFSPGENVGPNVILPVSGSTERGQSQTGSQISANGGGSGE